MQKPAREQGLNLQLEIMLDDCGFELYEENAFPLAYLLTFRMYGTWLHGDDRGSVRRNGNNRFGGPRITPGIPLLEEMQDLQKRPPLLLDALRRNCVEAAMIEVCEFRKYLSRAINVRTNHAHAVVSASVKPETIVNDFKVYATKRLRSKRLIGPEQRVWSRGTSTRYLWKSKHVLAAVDYVLYCQEDIPFEFK